MTTLKAPLVDKVKAHTCRAIADIVLSCQRKDGYKGDNPFVDFVREIVRSKMMSSRAMAQVEDVFEDAVTFNEVIGRITEKVASSDQLIKPIAVFFCYQVYHHVEVGLAEERFLHSRERFRLRDVDKS